MSTNYYAMNRGIGRIEIRELNSEFRVITVFRRDGEYAGQLVDHIKGGMNEMFFDTDDRLHREEIRSMTTPVMSEYGDVYFPGTPEWIERFGAPE